MDEFFPFPIDQKAFTLLMINIVGLYGVWEVLHTSTPASRHPAHVNVRAPGEATSIMCGQLLPDFYDAKKDSAPPAS